MNLLHAGVDIAVLALWLGHESTKSTQAYIHADMKLKEQALARTTPAGIPAGRYPPATRCSPSSKTSDRIIPISRAAQPAAARGSRSHHRHNAGIGIIAVADDRSEGEDRFGSVQAPSRAAHRRRSAMR